MAELHVKFSENHMLEVAITKETCNGKGKPHVQALGSCAQLEISSLSISNRKGLKRQGSSFAGKQ